MANNRKKQGKRKPPAPKSPAQGPVDQGTTASQPKASQPKPRSARSEVMARDRRRRQRRKRIETAAIAAVVILAVGLLVGIPIRNAIENRQLASDLDGGTCNYDTESDPGNTGEHSESATFTVNPPSAGLHFPQAAAAGDYSSGQAPPDGQIVHSHEHGYITLWYKPGNEQVLTDLRRIYEQHRRDVLLVPRESLPTAVAATAWGKRLLCDTVDSERINKFFDAYVNEGPEKVPHP